MPISVQELKNRLSEIHNDEIELDESTYIKVFAQAKFIDKEYGEFFARVKSVLDGKKHPKRRVRIVKKKFEAKICKFCKNEFLLSGNRTIEKRQFCSKECAYGQRKLDTEIRKFAKLNKCLKCKKFTRNKEFCRFCELNARIEKGTASSSIVKNFLINNDNSCSVCKITEWQGKKISLELDHIDGNSENNLLLNVRLICPNCHSQTDNYKARNIGNGRFQRRIRIAEGKSY